LNSDLFVSTTCINCRLTWSPAVVTCLQTPVGDLLVSFTKDQDILDEALPDALYYSGIYGGCSES
jgi:hypothetical protein